MDVPDGSGLRPPVASPVAPIGMPAGPTGRLPWMPSGEVGSMPGEEVDVCAIAALPLRRTATIVAMNQRPMVSSCCRTVPRGGPDWPQKTSSVDPRIRRRGITGSLPASKPRHWHAG